MSIIWESVDASGLPDEKGQYLVWVADYSNSCAMIVGYDPEVGWRLAPSNLHSKIHYWAKIETRCRT